MSDIINFIQNQPDLFFLKGATDEEILQAEKSLGLEFDAEFRKYISVYGVASFNGHELTGICKSRRLNVVDATIEAKEKNTHIPNNFYVVEKLGIDGAIVWQSTDGCLYQTTFYSEPIKIARSLIEYFE